MHAKDNAYTSMAWGLHSEGKVMLLPKQADKLLYAKDRCSGSFPPCKPPHPSWSQFSHDWYIELASHLSLHPYTPLPRFESEVEPDVLIFGLSGHCC